MATTSLSAADHGASLGSVALVEEADLSPAHLSEDAVLVRGQAAAALRRLPDESIDCVVTSPPYWSVRRYGNQSRLGEEGSPEEYVERLVSELDELKRVIKPTGSFWLNLGDTYLRKNLCGIPWRVALALQGEGWILRNAVVWDKVKGNPDNAKDKLRDLYEFVFHFVRSRQYYYDVDAIRREPASPTVRDGVVVTPTGVSGVKYRRQIQKSHVLSATEKRAALAALERALQDVAAGRLADFRMIIRGQQRTTHSDATDVSGRAIEIARDGFCVLPYHPKGSKPGDVWQVIPEDRWRLDSHCAVYPEELCRIPILATAPPRGIVLDPFAGTGTTVKVAWDHGLRAIGIDENRHYLEVARARLKNEAAQLRLA